MYFIYTGLGGQRGLHTHTTLELKQYVRAHFCCFSITSCLCHKLLLVSELPPSSPLLFSLPPFSSIVEEIHLLYLPPTSPPCLSYLVRNPSPTSYPPPLKRPSSYFPFLFITQQTNREEWKQQILLSAHIKWRCDVCISYTHTRAIGWWRDSFNIDPDPLCQISLTGPHQTFSKVLKVVSPLSWQEKQEPLSLLSHRVHGVRQLFMFIWSEHAFLTKVRNHFINVQLLAENDKMILNSASAHSWNLAMMKDICFQQQLPKVRNKSSWPARQTFVIADIPYLWTHTLSCTSLLMQLATVIEVM